jgi:hypothetical protein
MSVDSENEVAMSTPRTEVDELSGLNASELIESSTEATLSDTNWHAYQRP